MSRQLNDTELPFYSTLPATLPLPIIYWISMKKLAGKKSSVYLPQMGVAATERE